MVDSDIITSGNESRFRTTAKQKINVGSLRLCREADVETRKSDVLIALHINEKISSFVFCINYSFTKAVSLN